MQVETTIPIEYQTKLESLEKEILKLKKGVFGFGKKNISLKGMLKGVDIKEIDIEKAKKSVFKNIEL